MNVEDRRPCRSCGNELSGAMEFCPVCMLRRALEGGPKSEGSSYSKDMVEPELEPASHRFEHYELVTDDGGRPIELGRGAMGITYKAFDVDLRCVVTLKVITARYLNDESARLRFLREARAAASVRHPNVASVFHLGRTGENYFYAMEFVEGETLESLIRRSGRLEVKLALEILAQVAAGLVAVHEQKLVHRDIKPTNIMVSLKDGSRVTAKIIDLGLSKTVTESPSQPAISMPGAFAGTPGFASPEQFAGVGVDIRSDLYSFGVTLWQMLTGKLPFHGSPAEVMYQHQHAPVPLEKLINVPQPVIALLKVLLEKDPKWRFQNPTELLNALTKVNEAVKARRTIAHRSLREITDQQLGAPGKAIEILRNLRDDVPPVRRVRTLIWAALVLVIGGGTILTVAILFGPKRIPPLASRSFSPAITAQAKSIAVLPFESLSSSKDDSYFADGVQEEILSNLAKVSALRVISRTSVMTFRATKNQDLRSIATALDVAQVLEGTVRRDANRVRVTTELIDAGTDGTLWSESYDRDLTDIFAVQSEIAQTVVAKLKARLLPEEKQAIEEKPTENLEAYDLYLRAQVLITSAASSIDSGDTQQIFLDAIALLEKATRLDSAFVLAYCQIAKADDWLYVLGLDSAAQRRLHGDAAVDQALRLGPNLPEAHLAAAFHLYICYRDYHEARIHITVAKQALPNNADALALDGYLDRRQGRWSESIEALERAISLDPRNPEILTQLGASYSYLRKYDEYEKVCDRLIALEPEEPSLKARKASISLDEKGELTGQRALLEALQSSTKGNILNIANLYDVLVYSRDWMRARELVKSCSMEELLLGFGDDPPLVPRICLEIPISKYQEEHPETNAELLAGRDHLLHKVGANPGDPRLLSVLGLIDAYLGRKQEALREGKRAVEMLPVSKDAVDAPALVDNLAAIYSLSNEPDLAFQWLEISIKTPGGRSYGELKLDPAWDPIRTDPRFDKLLAQLAPKE
jgi:serine/threonine protein kinase/tetratricopeptide (TPR) repeat protein